MITLFWRLWTLFVVGWDALLWATGRYTLAGIFVIVVVFSLAMTAFSKAHRL